MASKRIIQGGSTLTFALIGVALAVIVVGLLFWANQRSQQTNQPTAPLGTNQGTTTTDQTQTGGSAAEGAKPDANKTGDGAKNTAGSSSGEQGAGSTQSPTAGAGVADGMTGGAAQDSQASASAGSGNGVAQLPQTGPADTLISVVAVALLVGGTVAYLRSRAYAQSQLS